MDDNVKPMTVADFVAFLQTQPQELPVAYCLYSEQVLLQSRDIKVVELCLPRPDGWVHDKRPDRPHQRYLLLPGN